jgi:hypothetical protein
MQARCAPLLLTRRANAPTDVGTVYNSIGRVYRAHGRLDEALKYQRPLSSYTVRATIRLRSCRVSNAVAAVYQMQDKSHRRPGRTCKRHSIGSASMPAGGRGPRVQDFLRANMAEPAFGARATGAGGGRDRTGHRERSRYLSGRSLHAPRVDIPRWDAG